MTTVPLPVPIPQTAAEQIAALAPRYRDAATALFGSQLFFGRITESHLRRLIILAGHRLIQGHAEYGASGLFAYPDEQLQEEVDAELADAINYRAELLRRDEIRTGKATR